MSAWVCECSRNLLDRTQTVSQVVWRVEISFYCANLGSSEQAMYTMYVLEGNVIYSLVAFVIIDLRNIFLALIICMHDEEMENVSLA